MKSFKVASSYHDGESVALPDNIQQLIDNFKQENVNFFRLVTANTRESQASVSQSMASQMDPSMSLKIRPDTMRSEMKSIHDQLANLRGIMCEGLENSYNVGGLTK